MFPPPPQMDLFPEPSPGRIDEVLPDHLRVRWQGSIWPARLISGERDRPRLLLPGQPVLVLGRAGIELLVQI